MKKLNELVELAKEICSKQWFLNADEEVAAVDNDAGPDDSAEAFIGCAANIQLANYIAAASPETILAIAEAFRAMEQRAEAAEAGFRENEQTKQELFVTRDNLLTANLNAGKRIRELEAKLAELENQEPLAWMFEDELPENYPYDRMFPYSKVDVVRMFPVFGPAPAINLSELVPDGWKLVPVDPTIAPAASSPLSTRANTHRVMAAADALCAYASRNGLNKNEECAFTTVQDLLNDLMHLCDQEGITGPNMSFDTIFHWAQASYELDLKHENDASQEAAQ